mgnify:FL=1
MRTVEIIYGPPGTGKTTALLNIVESALNRGVKPEKIAYLAFTRKAAYEAQERAMIKFNLDENRFPYFRTLHSLAFKQLGLQRDEIMTDNHFRKLGKALGVEFRGIYDEDLGIHTGDGLGDKCSRIDSLARINMRPISEQYCFTPINDLTLHAANQYSKSLEAYKRDNGLMDFTDMLEQYESPLDVDICIFDEAQDLSSLQFSMAIKLAKEATEVYIAGDDDQAIFRWAGADVNKFLNLNGSKKVLPQSYRIPASVHKIANDIVSRIKNRVPKMWSPRAEIGSVEHVVNENEIDYGGEGTWMLLSRSKYLLNRFKKAVRLQGYPYTIHGKSSLDTDESFAITSWEKLRKGQRVTNHEAKNLKNYFMKASKIEKLDTYGVTDFGLPEDALKLDWMSMLRGIPADEREYIRSCLRNGYKFNDKPEITISTIHQSKGGEADNVVLLTDMGRLSWEALGTDEEQRVWYVAITRTKKNLFIVRQRGLRYFSI